MGLSDNERFSNAYNIVNALTDIKSKINSYRAYRDTYLVNYEHVLPLLEDLWPSLRSRSGNSLFWLAGGEFSRMLLPEDNSFLAAAFQNHLFNDYEDDIETTANYVSRYSASNLSGEPLCLTRWLDDYLRPVVDIFDLTESYFYSVNRYPGDTLSVAFNETSNLISKIQGWCFENFSRCDKFMLAWMSDHLFTVVLSYNDDDGITNWFKSCNMHHNVRLGKASKDYIVSNFRKAQRQEKFNSHERLEIILTYAGDRFHYNHEHQKLYKFIESHNKNNPKDKINLNKIKKMCNMATKQKEKKETSHITFCGLTSERRG